MSSSKNGEADTIEAFLLKNNCWFRRPPDPAARMRLICFPYAGGAASLFYSWQEHFPNGIQVCPIELPGRAARIGEPMPQSIAELVDRILDEAAPYFDRPVSLFGHSLGAIVAFELAKAIERKMNSPARLFASACRAPHVPRRRPSIHHLEDQEFIQALAKINGTPDEVLEHQELLHLLLPTLRADFRLSETYQYIPGRPLSCAITAICGQEDEFITRGDLVAWHSQTTGAFNLRMVPGAHFFLQPQANSIAKLVAGTIGRV